MLSKGKMNFSLSVLDERELYVWKEDKIFVRKAKILEISVIKFIHK